MKRKDHEKIKGGKKVDLDIKPEMRTGKCKECGVYRADHKGICEGCLAYREHTNVY